MGTDNAPPAEERVRLGLSDPQGGATIELKPTSLFSQGYGGPKTSAFA